MSCPFIAVEGLVGCAVQLNDSKKAFKILLMSTCMKKSMVSQQILSTVMTSIVVDKNTDHA